MNNKKVTIYSTPSCHFCHATKEFFTANKVVYEDHDVAADLARRQEMFDKSGQMGVPVITISESDGSNEKFVIGFDEPQLSTLLGL